MTPVLEAASHFVRSVYMGTCRWKGTLVSYISPSHFLPFFAPSSSRSTTRTGPRSKEDVGVHHIVCSVCSLHRPFRARWPPRPRARCGGLPVLTTRRLWSSSLRGSARLRPRWMLMWTRVAEAPCIMPGAPTRSEHAPGLGASIVDRPGSSEAAEGCWLGVSLWQLARCSGERHDGVCAGWTLIHPGSNRPS